MNGCDVIALKPSAKKMAAADSLENETQAKFEGKMSAVNVITCNNRPIKRPLLT